MAEQGPGAAFPARIWGAFAIALLTLAASGGRAQTTIQGFTVTPVRVEMAAGQRATLLTIENQTAREATFQVRPYAWSQPGGGDQLDPTEALLASPPLGVLPPGAKQVVRLVLRGPAPARETTYRILLDQIPSQAAPGKVGFQLRLSIPVFVAPSDRRGPPLLQWEVIAEGPAATLVARNDGGRRQVVHDLGLATADGRALALESNASPYILAGGLRRWRILGLPALLRAGETLRLTAHADTGGIDQAVPVRRVGP
jgi:fimbrial chaperone protein